MNTTERAPSPATALAWCCLVAGICLLFLLVLMGNPEPALPNCPARATTIRCAP